MNQEYCTKSLSSSREKIQISSCKNMLKPSYSSEALEPKRLTQELIFFFIKLKKTRVHVALWYSGSLWKYEVVSTDK